MSPAPLVCLLTLPAIDVCAADRLLPSGGNLLGVIVDPQGTPQNHASVDLFNRYQRVVGHASTDEHGRFAFADLPMDVYSVRAYVASYLPAVKNKILIQNGLDSMLRIHLATLVSSMELVYVVPTSSMSDEWKWVLRSAPATRPVTRFVEARTQNERADATEDDAPGTPVFSRTHASVSLSGGSGGMVDSDGFASDGTRVALSTSIHGHHQVSVAGLFNEGVTQGPPQVGLAASYRHSEQSGTALAPEVSFSMLQVGGLDGPLSSLPRTPLRSMQIGVFNGFDVMDNIHVEAGATGESVDFVEHTSRVSPYARITMDGAAGTSLVLAFSNGGRPEGLLRQSGPEGGEGEEAPFENVTALGRLPEISSRNQSLRVQRTRNSELTWKKSGASDSVAITMFQEHIHDMRLHVAGRGDSVFSDLLSDGLSTTAYANAPNFRRQGIVLSASHKFNEHLRATAAWGQMGGTLPSASLADLCSQMRNVAGVDLAVSMPGAGTRLMADYGWTETGSFVPRHVFITQPMDIAPGLNFQLRQPLPVAAGFPGRLELTISAQNLLAQGYLPMVGNAGQRLLVVENPRSVRGGLSLIF